jgi:hypothetical protein
MHNTIWCLKGLKIMFYCLVKIERKEYLRGVLDGQTKNG